MRGKAVRLNEMRVHTVILKNTFRLVLGDCREHGQYTEILLSRHWGSLLEVRSLNIS